MTQKASVNKRVTIKQVAERAGVTIGTVSNMLNGTAHVASETAIRIREAIQELNYVPNMTAKSLRSKKSKLIGFLIPNINNSFYSRISSTFIDLASQNGYVVQMFSYEYSLEKELQAINNVANSSIDTVIIMNGHDDEQGIRQLLDMRKTVILADRISDMKGVSCVYFDNGKGITEAVDFLKSKGYKRIGFLTEPLTLTNVQERFEVYKAALQKYGYMVSEENMFICEQFQLNPMVNGYQYMKNILQTRKKESLPDAFIASSDLLAIGVMKAFWDSGYSIPGDVGIIGFDNLELSSFVNPALTTIEQNQVLMGTELFRMVESLNEEGDEKKVSLSQTLIVRESC